MAPLWAVVGLMLLVGLPGIVLRVGGIHPPAAVAAMIFGFAILAAAFLLGWAAETAELDLSQGLALAIIALIAVLPEYAVSFVLAWDAGADPEVAKQGLAVANMTGGNRLLIGIGWPVVFALFFYRTRLTTLVVDRQRALELVFLAVATLYGLSIPLRHTVSLIDGIVLGTLFIVYLVFTGRAQSEGPVLVGPARAMGALSDLPRRSMVAGILVFSAAVIFCSAEPFADALVHLGRQLGVSEFVLIQWLAPLASESPEVLVAGMLAFRGRGAHGMGVLISSKVNQWTLLIGTLPVAFLLSAGDFSLLGGLPLDGREREEIFLTAAQSAFAIAVFANLRMGGREAIALFVLFATQLFITNESVRLVYAVLYSVLCVVLLVVNRAEIPDTLRAAWDVLRGRDEEAVDRVAAGAEE
jgi:cation:H+ antiporter